MQIKDLYNKKPVISLEIFPPKPGMPVSTIFETIDGLKELRPDFISVTYGAGGSSRENTVSLAHILKSKYGLEALTHLTCISSTKSEVDDIIARLKAAGVENILAMRGDYPAGYRADNRSNPDFRYAADLIGYIRGSGDTDLRGGFCLGGACYPEGHIECISSHEDLKHLKYKVEAGLDFLITQLFFDNELFYTFLEKLYALGIKLPVSAGIMPVINKKQIVHITQLCGASITPKFKRILEKYEYNPAALKEAGIAYATEQIIDLLSYGTDGIHLYTMNRPEVARSIFGGIESIREHFNSK